MIILQDGRDGTWWPKLERGERFGSEEGKIYSSPSQAVTAFILASVQGCGRHCTRPLSALSPMPTVMSLAPLSHFTSTNVVVNKERDDNTK